MTTLRKRLLGLLLAGVAALTTLLAAPAALADGKDARPPAGKLLAAGLLGTSGATVGPDGALYVVQGALGEVTRIDPRTGKQRTFARNLPPAVIPIGGAIDVAFIGRTAYVLVTLVGQFSGAGDGIDGVDGIYRVNSKNDPELIADLGEFSKDNPPLTPFDLSRGVQYALEPVDRGFLVSDGHHNRILHVTLDGAISVLKQYDNVVPTGMAGGKFGTAFVAELGAVPNPPEAGKVTSFGLLDPEPLTPRAPVASGVPMIVDVEFGPDGRLYALSQGDLGSQVPGDPAEANTGRLLQVKSNGRFKVLAHGLDRPTSLNFVCGAAAVVTLTGEVRLFHGIAGHGKGCKEWGK